ncbi:MAG: hypothetical protein QOC71_835 [Thermoplasmata archaeon]|nr:hypothetical protein [Thermoplasmata archaeon]
MTIAREWSIALALGLVVAAALWAMPHGGPGSGGDGDGGPTVTGAASSSSGPKPFFTFPFDGSAGPVGGETSFLVLAPQGRAAAERHLNDTGLHDQTVGDLDWVNDRLAYFTPRNAQQGCFQVNGSMACSDPVWAFHAWPLPKAIAVQDASLGPRLGIDGYNATRATIYVFDERGLLAATNDAPANHTRFPGSPTTMDSATWYIGGNATAPNGTQKPPSFAAPLVQKLRPLMEGLPVGGVASTQSNAYVSLYGTLFITIRIDSLSYAP